MSDTPAVVETIFNINGTVVLEDQAVLPVLDHAFLYGDGVFETVVAHKQAIFRFDEHLDRLDRSLRAIALDLPIPRDTLARWIQDTVDACDAETAYVKWIVTRGSNGTPLMDPAGCVPNVVILARPYISNASNDRATRGLTLLTAATRRPSSVVLDARIKGLNYLNLILAKLEAQAGGADDALLLDTHGHVCEAPGYNIFAVHGQRLITPSNDILEGITRDVVIELAPEHALDVTVGTVDRYHLYNADEVFLCSTAGGVIAVTTIDGRTIGAGQPGPITGALNAAYWELVRTDPPIKAGDDGHGRTQP